MEVATTTTEAHLSAIHQSLLQISATLGRMLTYGCVNATSSPDAVVPAKCSTVGLNPNIGAVEVVEITHGVAAAALPAPLLLPDRIVASVVPEMALHLGAPKVFEEIPMSSDTTSVVSKLHAETGLSQCNFCGISISRKDAKAMQLATDHLLDKMPAWGRGGFSPGHNEQPNVGILPSWQHGGFSSDHGMLASLGNLLNLGNTSAAENVLPTTYGCLRTPLKKHPPKILEFISVLLTIGSETADKELISQSAIKRCTDLFFPEEPVHQSQQKACSRCYFHMQLRLFGFDIHQLCNLTTHDGIPWDPGGIHGSKILAIAWGQAMFHRGGSVTPGVHPGLGLACWWLYMGLGQLVNTWSRKDKGETRARKWAWNRTDRKRLWPSSSSSYLLSYPDEFISST